MPNLSYDDSAAGFFGIATLSLFALPASIYVLRTVFTFKPTSTAPSRKVSPIPAQGPPGRPPRALDSHPPFRPPFSSLSLSLSSRSQGRTEAETKKLQDAAAARPTAKLWTPGFTGFTVATLLAVAAIVYLSLTVTPGAELAVYDPFQVSSKGHRRRDRTPGISPSLGRLNTRRVPRVRRISTARRRVQ
jgi:hypothetical protein